MSYARLNVVYGVDIRTELDDNRLFDNDLAILEENEEIAAGYYDGGTLIGTDFDHTIDVLDNIKLEDIYKPNAYELQAAVDDFKNKMRLIAEHPELSDEFKEKVLEFEPSVFLLISYS